LPNAKTPSNSPAPFHVSTRIDGGAQLSPDSKRVAFHSNRSTNNHEIWVCDSAGPKCTQMTSVGTDTGAPRWSPDGKRIVCQSSKDGKTSIYTLDLDTREVRRLIADPSEERNPSWSRDGQWVYFGSKRSGSWQIWKVIAEGGTPVQITQQGGFLPCESPDGRFVYYAKGGEVAGVWRVPIDGGEEILILDQLKPDMYANWAVVDDGIYFIQFDINVKAKGALLFYDFDKRRVKEIAKLGSSHILPGGLAVSADRRSFFYTVWEHEAGSDIMLVENYR
jgi:Tol biopolymer transport system component